MTININVGDVWLGTLHEWPGIYTFQMVAECLDQCGNRVLVGLKHIPYKRKFLTGDGAAIWFDENGKEPGVGGFYLYAKSHAKPIPTILS